MKLNYEELAAGSIFCLFGIAFLGAALFNLDIGTSRQMGPGYFPVAVAILLILFGAGIALPSVRSSIHAYEGPFPYRAVLVIGISPILFVFAIGPLGFVPAVAIIAFVSSFASVKMTLPKAVLLSAGLSLLCIVVFIQLLGLPLTYLGSLFG